MRALVVTALLKVDGGGRHIEVQAYTGVRVYNYTGDTGDTYICMPVYKSM